MKKVLEYVWIASKRDGLMHIRFGSSGRYERPFCGAKGRSVAANTNVFCITCEKGIRLFPMQSRCVGWSSSALNGGREEGARP